MERSRHWLTSPVNRKIFFAFLYFCEGAPIGFIWWMLPAYLRSSGVELETITLLTSILILPWVFKFLWAPFVDSLQSERWSLVSWIMAAQLIMVVSLVPLLFLDSVSHSGIMLFLLLLHSIAAATQDVAIDALCIALVPEQEMGSVNGWMQAGMLAGRSLFGGVALITAALFSIQTLLIAMITMILLATLLVVIQKIPAQLQPPRRTADTWKVIRNIGSQRETWYAVLFAIIGGLAFEGVGIVAGPFLVDRGVPTEYIGLFFSVGTVTAMTAGSVIGGLISDRKGIVWTVRRMTLVMAASVAILAATDYMITEYRIVMLIGALILIYGTIGLFTVSSYALFMSLSDRRIGATQFSAYMGATNACEAIAGFSAGRMVPVIGYPSTFITLAVISAASIMLIPRMRRPE